MARNFLNRRSTPVSHSRSSIIQDLVIPEVSLDDFKLDSWGRDFETEINQKLYEAYESGQKKYEEYLKKKHFNQISLKAVKNRISELEESSSRSLLIIPEPEFISNGVTVQDETHAVEDKTLEQNAAPESMEGKILSIEILPPEAVTSAIIDNCKSSLETIDDTEPFNPPRPPVDLEKMELEREQLLVELNETNTILRDLNIEVKVLEQDLGYYDNSLDLLTQACRASFKEFIDKLNKLKLSGYVNKFEMDVAKKLTMFFKMILTDNPPNPDLLGKSLDKMFGDESNYFQMPDINTVLAKYQQSTSVKNAGGSRNNLLGSSANLKGSSKNLKGSSMGLGEWTSSMQLADQSFSSLLDQ